MTSPSLPDQPDTDPMDLSWEKEILEDITNNPRTISDHIAELAAAGDHWGADLLRQIQQLSAPCIHGVPRPL